ncbi:REP element-mobilizing transposase RayT [Paraburkholderia silvatlantica]|uniref:REP element-mobilizing transposase RayT n=1 Tax=Paraburkholderia silvatlantica TaxID=321895 RepID=A0ABR6FZY7_9BURK|nr:REP element-mobilizing transposase RayT [Paraburkholderia silvatlantica]PVY20893.1 REP element-mobilizing transposase RayT [Paraburkholderia silvatlantica]PXW25962.1 REP element-mobilizing transposase RayT [Paraburkholderia silvatlantica]
MARLARLYVPDQPQHVILRGLDQQPAFVDDQDYELFIDCLKAAARDHHLAVHAWVLMPGAVQLLVTPSDESSLPKAMQAVGRRYVAHFNRRYARRGTLWEGRYRATVIEGERFFLLASRVVELAPVRSHLVTAPEDYRWSSYRHHIGLTVDSLITDHPLYWALGNTPFERQRAYRELCEQVLDERETTQLMQATLKGWVLGSDTYRDWASRTANRRVSPLPRGRPRKVREAPGTPAATPGGIGATATASAASAPAGGSGGAGGQPAGHGATQSGPHSTSHSGANPAGSGSTHGGGHAGSGSATTSGGNPGGAGGHSGGSQGSGSGGSSGSGSEHDERKPGTGTH